MSASPDNDGGYDLADEPAVPGPPPRVRRASAFAVPAPARPLAVDDDRDGQLFLIVLTVVSLLVVVGGGAIGWTAWKHAHPPVVYLGDDGKVAQLAADVGAAEIHTWFEQDSTRIAGPYNQRQALHLADTLQQMGAKQVLAFGPQLTTILAVELPDDPQQRKALFAWQWDYNLQHRFKPATDVGQHYVLLGIGIFENR